MQINEYQKLALMTAKITDDRTLLTEGVMGLSGEAGECLDLVKKHLFQGHELDEEKLALELGDVAWYLATSSAAIGYPLEKVMEMNIEKLRKRYPRGFEESRSIYREDEEE